MRDLERRTEMRLELEGVGPNIYDDLRGVGVRTALRPELPYIERAFDPQQSSGHVPS
jgi:hypothetical protein